MATYYHRLHKSNFYWYGFCMISPCLSVCQFRSQLLRFACIARMLSICLQSDRVEQYLFQLGLIFLTFILPVGYASHYYYAHDCVSLNLFSMLLALKCCHRRAILND